MKKREKPACPSREWPEIRVTPSFCLILAVSCLFDRSGYFSCMLLAILIHECGHLLAMVFFHCPVKQVSFRIFGIEIIGDLPTGRKRGLIMLAGPLANLLTALVFLSFTGYGQNLCMCSLLLGLFHLLPLTGLDGSAALLSLTKEHPLTKGICTGLTAVSILLFSAVGLYIAFSAGNLSLLILAGYFFMNYCSIKKKSV